MIKLSDDMRNMIDPALANGRPCILATVSGDGEPISAIKAASWFLTTSRLPIGSAPARASEECSGKSQSDRAFPRCQDQSACVFTAKLRSMKKTRYGSRSARHSGGGTR